MSQTMEFVREHMAFAVLRTRTPEECRMAAHSLVDGGVRIVEITLTTPEAYRLIEEIGRRDGVLVGAGTVMDTDQAGRALAAGARFIVSPFVDPALIAFVKAEGSVVMPGAATPTEMVTAWRAGADVVKVFPAASLGGPAYIRALRGPLPGIPMMPTGGVSLDNAIEYMNEGCIAFGLGGSVFPAALIEKGDRKALQAIGARIVRVVKGWKELHPPR